MLDRSLEPSLMILLIGGLVVASIIVRWGFESAGIPPLVGYLLMGFLLRLVDSTYGFLSEGIVTGLEYMAELGIIALLFRVGLESKPAGLLAQLKRAQFIWRNEVGLSAILGFVASYYVLGFPLTPSLFVAAALTATSVGVSVAVWRDAGAIGSPNGELLLDVAELDDISAVLLMALLLTVAGSLENHAPVLSTVLQTAGLLLLKLTLFVAVCYLFSRHVERRLTRFVERIEPMPAPMLMVLGVGFVFAALAGLLGFSIALGAFFAGLIFSRDPDALKIDAPFQSLYEFFTPFFFINIGSKFDTGVLTSSLFAGGVLLVAAVIGKVVGAGGSAVRSLGIGSALLLGVSMIPRAEIAMIVMEQGRRMGERVVPADAFSAVVIVSAATCFLSPLLVRPLLSRFPQTAKSE